MEILLGLVVLILFVAALAAIRKAERQRPWISKRAMRRFERTFSWFGRNRRLAKDFENLAETLPPFVTPRFHPAGPQAACRGVDRELNKPPVVNAR